MHALFHLADNETTEGDLLYSPALNDCRTVVRVRGLSRMH